MRHFERHHGGWPRAGIALSAALVLLLWVTGLLLDAWPADQAPSLLRWQMQLRHAALVLHGVGAWAFCLFAGRWAWPHMSLVWRRAIDTTWWLGLLSAAIALLVATTGLLLLYGPGGSREASIAVHWWTAVGWPFLLGLHGRRLFTDSKRAAHDRRDCR